MNISEKDGKRREGGGTTTTTSLSTSTAAGGGGQQGQQQQQSSLASGVTAMTFEHFASCLDMLFESVLGLLKGAVGVGRFLRCSAGKRLN